MNTAFAMIAVSAAKASMPATMSFGLYSRMRSARLRRSLSIAATAAPRRRGISSSGSIRLGTFLHLPVLVVMSGAWRRGECCDVAGRLVLRRERQRQGDGHRGTFVELALYGHVAAMQRDEAFHDRQSEPGALVTPLIGRAGLEERIADPLQIVRGDPDAGI